MQNQYSKTWQEKTLGDILEKGSSNLSANKLIDCDGEYPVYGASGLVKKINFYQQENEYLAIIKDGAGVGRVYHYPKKTSILGTMQYLYPKESVNIRFAYYYLTSIDFYKYYQGAAIPHIYYKDYKNEKLVLPSIQEQERIVGILDKVFENIEQAKKNAEQNLQNAKNLFDSELENIFTGNIEDWEKLNVGEIIKLEYGKALPYSDRCNNGENPVYGANGIKDRTNKYLHDKPSIIVGRKGSVGELNYVESKFWALDVTYYVKFDENQYNLNFLYYLLKRLKLQTLARGVKPGLNRNEVYNLNVAIPKINTQQQIVEKLDKLQEQVKSLEAIYEQKIKDLEELKQSILQKAFNGEL